MFGRVRTPVRLVLVVAMVAAWLVPAWVGPARAISIPVTLARTVRSEGAGRVATDFAPTHVAFSWRGPEGSAVAYRTFDGREASRWRRASEAHDIGYGRHHFSGVLSVARPDAIEWRKTGTGRSAMRDITVDYLNTVDGPRRRVVVPATAEAGTAADIVTRRQWGADESIRRNCTRYHYRVQQLFVHHTVGINNDPHPKATMRSMYWYHTVRRGWCDIGYNFVIAPDGRIFEGRFARNYRPGEIHDGETTGGKAVQGAHVSGYNSGSVGVSLMGNYSQVRPSAKMRNTLVHFLAWEARRHNLKPRANHTYRNPATGLARWLPVIAGHRDAGQTECPGNYVYRSLSSIREDVARLVNKKPSVLTLESDVESTTFWDEVDLTGDLRKKDGGALANRLVRLKRRTGPDAPWTTVDSTRTSISGSFSFTDAPRENGGFKAAFGGDGRFGRSKSGRVAIWVHARVVIGAQGGSDVGGVPHFIPGSDVPLAGRVAPKHPGSDVVVVIKQMQVGEYEVIEKTDLVLNGDSRFMHPFAGEPGAYRASARFPADDDHARGVSPDFDFVIGP